MKNKLDPALVKNFISILWNQKKDTKISWDLPFNLFSEESFRKNIKNYFKCKIWVFD
jgi:hypothetical protein